MLHAEALAFEHPTTGDLMVCTAPAPFRAAGDVGDATVVTLPAVAVDRATAEQAVTAEGGTLDDNG